MFDLLFRPEKNDFLLLRGLTHVLTGLGLLWLIAVLLYTVLIVANPDRPGIWLLAAGWGGPFVVILLSQLIRLFIMNWLDIKRIREEGQNEFAKGFRLQPAGMTNFDGSGFRACYTSELRTHGACGF